ncbi:hypothetical protein N9O99_02145 [Schleiferiaceae bacterium]|jgi:hypothetical protein|nr:hypothetical protein [Schleiferiaceae bacterium]
MKKLLSILSLCLVFISCSPDRVLYDELTQKGEISYFEGKPFTGVAFDIYSNGQLKLQINYKDGKFNGLAEEWNENGELIDAGNFKNGEMILAKPNQ